MPITPSVPAAHPANYQLPLAHLTVEPDVAIWEERTTTPDFVPYQGLTDWGCVFLLPEPLQPGSWQLVGFAESYTPILDIVADRTGLPLRSNNTYYIFRLNVDDE